MTSTAFVLLFFQRSLFPYLIFTFYIKIGMTRASINSSVAADPKVSPNWSLKTMTCHSSHCFSIVWG